MAVIAEHSMAEAARLCGRRDGPCDAGGRSRSHDIPPTGYNPPLGPHPSCHCRQAHDSAFTRSSRLIGRGGMGEVYRARDTRLGAGRRAEDATGRRGVRPGWRTRFEREARALASLNHPNIAAIYGLEESGLGSTRRRVSHRNRHGAGGRRNAGRSPEPRPASAGRSAPRGRTDRRRARGGAPQGHRPSRSQARQREDHAERAR